MVGVPKTRILRRQYVACISLDSPSLGPDEVGGTRGLFAALIREECIEYVDVAPAITQVREHVNPVARMLVRSSECMWRDYSRATDQDPNVYHSSALGSEML